LCSAARRMNSSIWFDRSGGCCCARGDPEFRRATCYRIPAGDICPPARLIRSMSTCASGGSSPPGLRSTCPLFPVRPLRGNHEDPSHLVHRVNSASSSASSSLEAHLCISRVHNHVAFQFFCAYLGVFYGFIWTPRRAACINKQPKRNKTVH
jgi:hypothetical protein